MAIIASYCIDIAGQQASWQRFNNERDHQQALQYSNAARRQQFLASRALLRRLVSEHIDAEQHLSVLKYPSGAPYLRLAERQLSCSISHTDNAVLVAISNDAAAFGVDIERFDDRRWQRNRVIDKYQHGMMQQVGSSSLARAQRWNVAEAVVKAEQGKLLEVLQRQPEPLLAHASVGTLGDYCYAIYHPHCSAAEVRLIPVVATN